MTIWQICCDEPSTFFSTPQPDFALHEVKSAHAHLNTNGIGCKHNHDSRGNTNGCSCDHYPPFGNDNNKNAFKAESATGDGSGVITATTTLQPFQVQDEEIQNKDKTTTTKRPRLNFPELEEYFPDEKIKDDSSTNVALEEILSGGVDEDDAFQGRNDRIDAAFGESGDKTTEKSTLVESLGQSINFPSLHEYFPENGNSDVEIGEDNDATTSTTTSSQAYNKEATNSPEAFGEEQISRNEEAPVVSPEDHKIHATGEHDTDEKTEEENDSLESMSLKPGKEITEPISDSQEQYDFDDMDILEVPETSTVKKPLIPEDFPDVTETIIHGDQDGRKESLSLELEKTLVTDSSKMEIASVPGSYSTETQKIDNGYTPSMEATTMVSLIKNDSSLGRRPFALSTDNENANDFYSKVTTVQSIPLETNDETTEEPSAIDPEILKDMELLNNDRTSLFTTSNSEENIKGDDMSVQTTLSLVKGDDSQEGNAKEEGEAIRTTVTSVGDKVDMGEILTTSASVKIGEREPTTMTSQPPTKIDENEPSITTFSPLIKMDESEPTPTPLPSLGKVDESESTHTTLPPAVNMNETEPTLTTLPPAPAVKMDEIEPQNTTLPPSVKMDESEPITTALPSPVGMDESEPLTHLRSSVANDENEFTTILPLSIKDDVSESTTTSFTATLYETEPLATSIPPVKIYESESTTTLKSSATIDHSEPTIASLSLSAKDGESESTITLKSIATIDQSDSTTTLKSSTTINQSESTTTLKSSPVIDQSEPTIASLSLSVKDGESESTTTTPPSVKVDLVETTTTLPSSVLSETEPANQLETKTILPLVVNEETESSSTLPPSVKMDESEFRTNLKSAASIEESEPTTVTLKSSAAIDENEPSTTALPVSVKDNENDSTTTTSALSVKVDETEPLVTTLPSAKMDESDLPSTTLSHPAILDESESATHLRSSATIDESEPTTTLSSPVNVVDESEHTLLTTPLPVMMDATEASTTLPSPMDKIKAQSVTTLKSTVDNDEVQTTTNLLLSAIQDEPEPTTNEPANMLASTTILPNSVKLDDSEPTTTLLPSAKMDGTEPTMHVLHADDATALNSTSESNRDKDSVHTDLTTTELPSSTANLSEMTSTEFDDEETTPVTSSIKTDDRSKFETDINSAGIEKLAAQTETPIVTQSPSSFTSEIIFRNEDLPMSTMVSVVTMEERTEKMESIHFLNDDDEKSVATNNPVVKHTTSLKTVPDGLHNDVTTTSSPVTLGNETVPFSQPEELEMITTLSPAQIAGENVTAISQEEILAPNLSTSTNAPMNEQTNTDESSTNNSLDGQSIPTTMQSILDISMSLINVVTTTLAPSEDLSEASQTTTFASNVDLTTTSPLEPRSHATATNSSLTTITESAEEGQHNNVPETTMATGAMHNMESLHSPEVSETTTVLPVNMDQADLSSISDEDYLQNELPTARKVGESLLRQNNNTTVTSSLQVIEEEGFKSTTILPEEGSFNMGTVKSIYGEQTMSTQTPVENEVTAGTLKIIELPATTPVPQNMTTTLASKSSVDDTTAQVPHSKMINGENNENVESSTINFATVSGVFDEENSENSQELNSKESGQENQIATTISPNKISSGENDDNVSGEEVINTSNRNDINLKIDHSTETTTQNHVAEATTPGVNLQMTEQIPSEASVMTMKPPAATTLPVAHDAMQKEEESTTMIDSMDFGTTAEAITGSSLILDAEKQNETEMLQARTAGRGVPLPIAHEKELIFERQSPTLNTSTPEFSPTVESKSVATSSNDAVNDETNNGSTTEGKMENDEIIGETYSTTSHEGLLPEDRTNQTFSQTEYEQASTTLGTGLREFKMADEHTTHSTILTAFDEESTSLPFNKDQSMVVSATEKQFLDFPSTTQVVDLLEEEKIVNAEDFISTTPETTTSLNTSEMDDQIVSTSQATNIKDNSEILQSRDAFEFEITDVTSTSPSLKQSEEVVGFTETLSNGEVLKDADILMDVTTLEPFNETPLMSTRLPSTRKKIGQDPIRNEEDATTTEASDSGSGGSLQTTSTEETLMGPFETTVKINEMYSKLNHSTTSINAEILDDAILETTTGSAESSSVRVAHTTDFTTANGISDQDMTTPTPSTTPKSLPPSTDIMISDEELMEAGSTMPSLSDVTTSFFTDATMSMTDLFTEDPVSKGRTSTTTTESSAITERANEATTGSATTQKIFDTTLNTNEINNRLQTFTEKSDLSTTVPAEARTESGIGTTESDKDADYDNLTTFHEVSAPIFDLVETTTFSPSAAQDFYNSSDSISGISSTSVGPSETTESSTEISLGFTTTQITTFENTTDIQDIYNAVQTTTEASNTETTASETHNVLTEIVESEPTTVSPSLQAQEENIATTSPSITSDRGAFDINDDANPTDSNMQSTTIPSNDSTTRLSFETTTQYVEKEKYSDSETISADDIELKESKPETTTNEKVVETTTFSILQNIAGETIDTELASRSDATTMKLPRSLMLEISAIHAITTTESSAAPTTANNIDLSEVFTNLSSLPFDDSIKITTENLLIDEDATGTTVKETIVDADMSNETHDSYAATTEYSDPDPMSIASTTETTKDSLLLNDMKEITSTIVPIMEDEMVMGEDGFPVTEITKSVRRRPDTDKTVVELTLMSSRRKNKVTKTVTAIRSGSEATVSELTTESPIPVFTTTAVPVEATTLQLTRSLEMDREDSSTSMLLDSIDIDTTTASDPGESSTLGGHNQTEMLQGRTAGRGVPLPISHEAELISDIKSVNPVAIHKINSSGSSVSTTKANSTNDMLTLLDLNEMQSDELDSTTTTSSEIIFEDMDMTSTFKSVEMQNITLSESENVFEMSYEDMSKITTIRSQISNETSVTVMPDQEIEYDDKVHENLESTTATSSDTKTEIIDENHKPETFTSRVPDEGIANTMLPSNESNTYDDALGTSTKLTITEEMYVETTTIMTDYSSIPLSTTSKSNVEGNTESTSSPESSTTDDNLQHLETATEITFATSMMGETKPIKTDASNIQAVNLSESTTEKDVESESINANKSSNLTDVASAMQTFKAFFNDGTTLLPEMITKPLDSSESFGGSTLHSNIESTIIPEIAEDEISTTEITTSPTTHVPTLSSANVLQLQSSTSTESPVIDVSTESTTVHEELIAVNAAEHNDTSTELFAMTTDATVMTTNKEENTDTTVTTTDLEEIYDTLFGAPSGRSARVNNLGSNAGYKIVETGTSALKTTTTPEPSFQIEVKVGPHDSRSLFPSYRTDEEKRLEGEISNVVNQLLLTTHRNFHLLPNFVECAGARGRTGRRKTKVLHFDTDNYPWMARIGFREPGGVLFPCAGTIITHKYILTSANCALRTSNGTASIMEILLEGAKNAATGISELSQYKYKVDEVIAHPNYNEKTRENDLALIRLAREIPSFNGSSDVKPICLPFEDGYGVWDSLPGEGQTAYLGGWGYGLKSKSSNTTVYLPSFYF